MKWLIGVLLMVVLVAGCTGQSSTSAPSTEPSCAFDENKTLWDGAGGIYSKPPVTTDAECDAACLVNFKKDHGEPTGKMTYGRYSDVSDSLNWYVECMCWVC